MPGWFGYGVRGEFGFSMLLPWEEVRFSQLGIAWILCWFVDSSAGGGSSALKREGSLVGR